MSTASDQLRTRKSAWQVFLMLAVLGAAAYWLWLLRRPTDPALRVSLAGMVLQLLGVTTVAVGIAQVRKRLGKPRLYRAIALSIGILASDLRDGTMRLRRYIVEHGRALVRRLLRKPKTITGSANLTVGPAALSAAGTASSVGYGTLTTTLNERVEILEKELAAHATEIAQLRTQLADEASARAHGISAEQSARARGDLELRDLLDDIQTGGIVLAFAGLIWLSFGIVMTSIPDWLASHLVEH